MKSDSKERLQRVALGAVGKCQCHHLEMSDNSLNSGAEYLVSLGEDIGDDWEEVDIKQVSSHTLDESTLNKALSLSLSIPGDARKTSEHDTSLFKVRYKYAGNPNPQRGFCRTVMLAKKAYRYEDLKAAENRVVNAGFGKGGTDRYSIWKYKGGVNCRHFWQRVIYLKKGNKKIGVNEARKMILDLEPSERDAARWEQNEKEVAQVASASNNYWKATFSKNKNLVEFFSSKLNLHSMGEIERSLDEILEEITEQVINHMNMNKIDFKGVVTPKTYGIGWNRPTMAIQQEQNRTEAKIESRKISNPKNAKQRLLNIVFNAQENFKGAPKEGVSKTELKEKVLTRLKTKRK